MIGIFLVLGCSGGIESEMAFIKDVVSSPLRMENWPQDSESTLRLLEKFRPRIFVAPKSYLPISFYQDYLLQCVVRQRKNPRTPQYQQVSRPLLQDIQFNPGTYLDYRVSAKAARRFDIKDVHPEIYGRIYTDVLSTDNLKTSLIFLKYSLIFPYSGLPSKIGRLKRLSSHLIGDPQGWHELDIHGAIHIILGGNTHQPLGVLLAQHNHHRIYLVGKDFKWPDDNRVSISFSQYSNEPYLMKDNAPYRLERTVGNPMHIAYLFGVTDKAPLGAGWDKIFSKKGGAREMPVELVLLPLNDPLYTAWIPMGNIDKIWGLWETWYRRGPPGIDFYTMGSLKNLADLTAFWFIDPKDQRFFALLEENFHNFEEYDLIPVLIHQRQRLATALMTL
ncbi:MAG: hypothetical protein JRF60_07000 [Deltaproteobacteria bacterium]|nr:hypothetical protein [Deltaproteobacteria bacterium]